MAIKEVMMPVKDIKQVFFVRARLNEDHALHLAELIETGVKLPPIEVAQLDDNSSEVVLVDGRHRLHAHEVVLDRKSVPTVFVKGTKEELLLRAMRANTGGSLATGGADINLVIRQLLVMNVPKTRIIQQMSMPNLPFTPSLIRRHVEDVNNRMIRDRVIQAQHAVAEGKMTAIRAADVFKVKLASLQTALGGNKKKITVRVNDLTGALTTIARSKSALIQKQISKALDMFENGDLSAGHVGIILDRFNEINKGAIKMHRDWTLRFEERKRLLESGGDDL